MRPNDDDRGDFSSDFRTFRNTVMDKVVFGGAVTGETTRLFALRQDRPSIGSISDTPPNTPSSFDGGSSTASSTIAISSSESTVRNAPSLSDDIRVASRLPNGDIKSPGVGTENFWIGQRLAGKQTSSRPMIKRYWEENIIKEVKEKAKEAAAASQKKPYEFPRWRSIDAMSASLVASAKSTEMIPKDSRIPAHRRQKMEQTEKAAEVEKRQIRLDAEPPKRLSKGKSLDSLNVQMKVDHRPWYDRSQIREAISRESIANLSETKTKFEQHSAWQPSKQLHRQTPVTHSYGHQHHPQQQQVYHKKDSPSDELMEYALDAEQFLFLQMLRQNMHLVQDFGIILPAKVKNLIGELHPVNVEIRQIAEVAPILSPRSHTPSQQHHTNGRYVKNHTSSTTHHPRFRRLYDMSVKEMPENKRQSMQELDQIRAGESLIAAEIRTINEREDELRRSRSEHGLPNLEDTIQIWRHGGYDQRRPMSQNSLQAAVSFDQLHQAPGGMKFNGGGKAGSVDHLDSDNSVHFSQNVISSREQRYHHQHQHQHGYRLHRSEDPDVMIYGPSTNQQRINTGSAIRITSPISYTQ